MTSKNDGVLFNPNYATDMLEQNKKLCCIVLDKNNKTLLTSIVEREAVSHWYATRTEKYDPRTHTFLIATVCVIGELMGIVPAQQEKKCEIKLDVN